MGTVVQMQLGGGGKNEQNVATKRGLACKIAIHDKPRWCEMGTVSIKGSSSLGRQHTMHCWANSCGRSSGPGKTMGVNRNKVLGEYEGDVKKSLGVRS